jgi:hypothetical protein
MLTEEKINFRQDRDFGETFNVTVKFIRQNFKHFFGTLILIAGPFILISAIAAGVNQAYTLGMLRSLSIEDFGYGRYGIIFFIYIAFAILATIVSASTCFAYMILYSERGPGNFKTSEVGNLVFKNIGKLFITLIVLLLMFAPIIAIFAGISYVVISSKLLVLIIGYYLMLLAGIAILLPNLVWLSSAVYLAAMLEKKTGVSAIKRSLELMRGNYWWTWLIMFCAVIALYVLVIIFSLPQIVYQLVITFSHVRGNLEDPGSSAPFVIITAVCTFLATIVFSIIHILSGFHYYSLAERKDGAGLLSRIDEIGNTADTNVEQQY